jgi:hypothetical protein
MVGNSSQAGSKIQTMSECISSLYRVAAIFPEQFESFTDTLKSVLFINYFAQIHLSCLQKGKQKKQTHSGNDESIGSYKSHVSLWTSRRKYPIKD